MFLLLWGRPRVVVTWVSCYRRSADKTTNPNYFRIVTVFSSVVLRISCVLTRDPLKSEKTGSFKKINCYAFISLSVNPLDPTESFNRYSEILGKLFIFVKNGSDWFFSCNLFVLKTLQVTFMSRYTEFPTRFVYVQHIFVVK